MKGKFKPSLRKFGDGFILRKYNSRIDVIHDDLTDSFSIKFIKYRKVKDATISIGATEMREFKFKTGNYIRVSNSIILSQSTFNDLVASMFTVFYPDQEIGIEKSIQAFNY